MFLKNAAEFVKLSHTVFALPFALISMLLAAGGLPDWKTIVLILICMFTARTAAMVFNRLADWEIDQENPRTERRNKLVTKNQALQMLFVSCGVFVAACWGLNLLCLVLSPIAIMIVFFYSLTKRFTSYSHFFLGLALAVAPLGAWAAVRGNLWDPIPYVLGLGVLLWVAGFDVIYASQDLEFDRKKGLNSLPVRLGLRGSLRLAGLLHVLAWGFFVAFGWLAGFSFWYGAAVLLAAGGLAYEHRLSRQGNVEAVNRAFFQVNAAVSAVLFLGVILEVWFR
jgi:4-hydroxybenzoate polyprenyltransferase